MRADLLTVITPYFNPIQFESRRSLMEEFVEHMHESGVRLIVVEAALGNRPFEVTQPNNPDHIQLRTGSLCWIKECLINIGARAAKTDHIAWLDGDIHFEDKDWARRTVDALQQYKVIQPWSDCLEKGPRGQHLNHFRSFARQYHYDQPYQATQSGAYEYWHPGFAWAARRDVLEALGGLIEFAILGAADHHMALSFIGRAAESVHGAMREHPALPAHLRHKAGMKHPALPDCTAHFSPYLRHVIAWEKRAKHHVNGALGMLEGTIRHGWHGRKADRKYWDRWQILIDEKFDPEFDTKRNLHGVVELEGNKPRLTHKIDRYFRERLEDANTTH